MRPSWAPNRIMAPRHVPPNWKLSHRASVSTRTGPPVRRTVGGSHQGGRNRLTGCRPTRTALRRPPFPGERRGARNAMMPHDQLSASVHRASNTKCRPSGEIAPRPLSPHLGRQIRSKRTGGPCSPSVSARAPETPSRQARWMQPRRPRGTSCAPPRERAGAADSMRGPAPESTAVAFSRRARSATDQRVPSRGSPGRRGPGREA